MTNFEIRQTPSELGSKILFRHSEQEYFRIKRGLDNTLPLNVELATLSTAMVKETLYYNN